MFIPKFYNILRITINIFKKFMKIILEISGFSAIFVPFLHPYSIISYYYSLFHFYYFFMLPFCAVNFYVSHFHSITFINLISGTRRVWGGINEVLKWKEDEFDQTASFVLQLFPIQLYQYLRPYFCLCNIIYFKHFTPFWEFKGKKNL